MWQPITLSLPLPCLPGHYRLYNFSDHRLKYTSASLGCLCQVFLTAMRKVTSKKASDMKTWRQYFTSLWIGEFDKVLRSQKEEEVVQPMKGENRSECVRHQSLERLTTPHVSYLACCIFTTILFVDSEILILRGKIHPLQKKRKVCFTANYACCLGTSGNTSDGESPCWQWQLALIF